MIRNFPSSLNRRVCSGTAFAIVYYNRAALMISNNGKNDQDSYKSRFTWIRLEKDKDKDIFLSR